MASPRDPEEHPDVTLTATEDVAVSPPPGGRASVPETEAFPPRGRERYAFEGEYARGGLGRILKALDHDLGRVVAIKELISTGTLAVERFAREARITARLEHPSIVPVHDLGQWSSGAPFYAMKLVSGRTLKDLIAGARDPQERLKLLPHVLAVSEAVAFAHSQFVVHRDLKPSNVLVGKFGETVVIDWGLAKSTGAPDERVETSVYRGDASAELTRVGAVIGTPAYMPPEQARGEVVDERADVYALGAMLHHTLSGSPPYQGIDSEHLISQVLKGPPSRLDASVIPEDLIAIVERSMARDPLLRYRDAAAFAEDLKRFITGQLVKAHTYRLRHLVRRWILRNRPLVVAASLFVAALLALGTVSIWRVLAEKREATAQRSVAEARRLDADHARNAAEQRADQLVLMQARAELTRDPTASMAWLQTYPATAPEHALARSLAAEALAGGAADFVYEGILWSNLQLSADGRTVALLTQSVRGVVLDVTTGQATFLPVQPSPLRPFLWSDDGKWLLTQNVGGTATLFRSGQWTQRNLDVTVLANERDAAFSRDSTQVALVEPNGHLSVWDVASGRRTHDLSCGKGALGLAFASDGSAVVTAHRTGLRVTDLRTGVTRDLLTTSVPGSGAISEARDGRSAVVTFGPNVFSIDLETTQVRQLVTEKGRLTPDPGGGYQITRDVPRDPLSHFSGVRAVAISADGTTVASTTDLEGVRIWDTGTGAHYDLAHMADRARRLCFSEDGRWLLVERDDHVVSRWLLDRDVYRHEDDLRLAGSALEDLAASSDGRRIFTINEQGQLRQWTDRGRTVPGRFLLSWISDSQVMYVGLDGNIYSDGFHQPQPELIGSCPVAREGAGRMRRREASELLVACIGDDGHVRVLDSRSRTSTTFDVPGKAVSVWVSGSHVLVLTDDGHAEVENLALQTSTTKRIGDLPAIADDGVAVAWMDGPAIRVWNTLTDVEFLVEAPPEARFWLFAAGNILVWKDQAGRMDVRVLEAPDGRSMQGLASAARPVAISPMGHYLVTFDASDVSAVWDTWTGAKLFEIPSVERHLIRFVAEDRFVTVSGEKVFIGRVDDGRLEHVLTAKRGISGLDVSRDGLVLVGSQDGATTLVDPISYVARVLPGEGSVARVLFSPDGRLVATADSSRVIRLRPDDLPTEGDKLRTELVRRSEVGISADGHVTGKQLETGP